LKLLSAAYKEVASDGWQIENVDVTVLAEAPKLVPHIPLMKLKIGEVLGLSPERIGIKATTTETLGFMGRREGVVASCVALLRR
jgi:2-C-methyl-D-erythritol 2,4-cyclodiphosphate synthase